MTESFAKRESLPRPPRVFVFGFDVGEAAQIRRVRGLQSIGAQVSSAMMRRSNMNPSLVPDWPNLVLADVENERIGRRLLTVLGSIARVAREPGLLAGSDMILARNFDMLIIAWAGRALTGNRSVPLVYECLDIHRLFVRCDGLGRFARWCERRLLARCAAVVVSSPGFLRNYFGPVQGYVGPAILIENKLWFDGPAVPRPATPRARQAGEPLTVGWVGSIRCTPSLRLLMAAADALGARVRIVISGNIHGHAVPDFAAEIARRPNVSYTGPYHYPDGLAAVYGGADVVWSQDLWQSGANSDWLLPNRIYEASYFGCPSIAVAGTETGRRIASDGLGFTIPAPTPDALVKLLSRLATEAGLASVRATSERLLGRPATDFQLLPDDYVRSFAPILSRHDQP